MTVRNEKCVLRTTIAITKDQGIVNVKGRKSHRLIDADQEDNVRMGKLKVEEFLTESGRSVIRIYTDNIFPKGKRGGSVHYTV